MRRDEVAASTGSQDSYEQAVYRSNPTLWFDSTNTSSATKMAGRITEMVERANAIKLKVTSTESPSQYLKDFGHNSFALSSQDEASLGSGKLAIDYDTAPNLAHLGKAGAPFTDSQAQGTLVVVGRYDPAHAALATKRGL